VGKGISSYFNSHKQSFLFLTGTRGHRQGIWEFNHNPLNPKQTTPVPNALFDVYLKELKATELKILLVIIRQTLGWVKKEGSGGRKNRDWISTSQLTRKTGASRRAISSGLVGLVKQGLIRISDDRGFDLQGASERKGKIRLYYELAWNYGATVDNLGKTGLKQLITGQTNTEIAQDMSKNVQNLAQKLRITKETLQN